MTPLIDPGVQLALAIAAFAAVLLMLIGAALYSRTREAAPGKPPRPTMTTSSYAALRWTGLSSMALGVLVALAAAAALIATEALA